MAVEVDGVAQGHDLEGFLKDAGADARKDDSDEEQGHHHTAGVASLGSQDADHEQLEREQRCDHLPVDCRPQLRARDIMKFLRGAKYWTLHTLSVSAACAVALNSNPRRNSVSLAQSFCTKSSCLCEPGMTG